MPYSVTGEHRYVFKNEERILLEGLLKPETAQNAAHAAVTKKGRGLYKTLPALKEIALKKHFAKIAASLGEETSLLLAFDEVLSAEDFFEIFKDLKNLWEKSSFSTIHSAYLFCLSPAHSEEERPFLPTTPGDALFFSSRWSCTPKKEKGGLFYLVVYAPLGAQYNPKEGDPHKNDLKSEGYSQGMRLKSSTHPLVYTP